LVDLFRMFIELLQPEILVVHSPQGVVDGMHQAQIPLLGLRKLIVNQI
jgi:hypothetical protein